MLVQRFEQRKDFLKLLRRELASVGEVFQLHFFHTILQQDAVELDVVVNVIGLLLARDAVKRRLRNIHKTLLYQLRHLAVKECQQQRADVRTVHIGVRHDDDFVVAQLLDVERAFAFAIADARAHGGDHRANFIVLKHLVQPRLLDVDQLAANRENRLKFPVATLLRRATGGITFDDIQLSVRRITVGTVRQLAGQPATGQRGFADGLTRLARRLARARRREALVNNALRHRRIRIEVAHQPFVSHRTGDALHFRRQQFHLCLRFKFRVAVLHRNDRRQTLAHIIAGDLRILFFQNFVRLRVLVDCARHRAAEAGQMRAAVGIVDRVGVAQHLVVVAVVILQHNLDVDLDFLVVELLLGFLAERDHLGMQRLLAFVELLDELLHAVLVKKPFRRGLRLALVGKNYFQAGIQKCQFAQALGNNRRLELHRLAENFRIRLEGDERAGFLGLANHFEFLDRLAALELHVIDLLVARHLDLKPFADRVHALRPDAVRAAGKFVAALAVFAAGVQRRQNQFHARQTRILVDVHRNAAPVIADGNRAVHMDRHFNVVAMAGEMFVHGIVQNFRDAMVQRALVRPADIHAGLLAHGLQPLKLAQF